MYSNAKANALVRDLGDKLSKRLAFSGTSVNTVAQGTWTDGSGQVWPNLVISQNGNVAEGQPVIYIQISGQDMISKDVFGNQTEAYAPHVSQIGYELGAAGNQTLPSHADIAACMFELVKVGARVQVKEIANGTAVTAANVNAASAISDNEELYWPTKSV
jgi:hypothetical protein